MKLVIIGQGAIGLLWYSQLHKHLKQQISLKVRSIAAHSLLPGRYAFSNLNGLSQQGKLHYANDQHLQNADVILICVKSYQVKQVISEISSLLASNSVIILCHNGVGTFDELPLLVKQTHPILAMITTQACLRASPFHAIHTGQGKTDLGLLCGQLLTGQEQQLLQLFNKALPEVCWHPNILAKQWVKLAVNCVINPLTAIHDLSNGEIARPQFSASITTILQEVIMVAKQQGMPMVLDDLLAMVYQVAQNTRRNTSSMRCDLLAKRPTEIEYINGYIQRCAQRCKLATPENARLAHQVRQLSKKKPLP
jgi:2-dehydropantoate 2-reductase